MKKVSCIEVISTQMFILLRQGLLPSENTQKLKKIKLVIHLLVTMFITGAAFINISNGIKSGDALLVNKMVFFLIPELNLLAKSFAIFNNRTLFLLLLKDLQSDAFNHHSANLNQHVQYVDKVNKLIMRYFAISMAVFITFTSALPIVTNLGLLVPYPFEMKKFEVAYGFIHLFMIAYLAVNSASYDVLLMSLIGICIAEWNILATRLINVYDDSVESFLTEDINNTNERVQKILKECIVLHETLNR